MNKNVSGQKLIVFAFDSTTNLPKSGDATNITAYVSKDYGAVTVLTDTSATEMDATNAKGYYLFDLTQGETNADTLLFTAKSSTANIVVVGVPATVFTAPTTGFVAPTVAGRTLDISATGEAGLDWANVGGQGTVVSLSNTTVDTVGTVLSVSGTVSAILANTAHGGTSATLRLGGSTSTPALFVTNSGGAACQFQATGGNNVGLNILGFGTGAGFSATGGDSGDGMKCTGGSTQGNGAQFFGPTLGNGLVLAGVGAFRVGLSCSSQNSYGVGINGSGSLPGLFIEGGPDGPGAVIRGGSVSGDAVQLTAQAGNSDALQLTPTGSGVAINSPSGILTSTDRDAVAVSHLDLVDGVETGLTVREGHRVNFAASAGKISGAATTNVLIRNKADTKNRINATVDASGNRSVVILDLT